MLALAEKHFNVLDKFAHRYATGTTGGLLNQLAKKSKAKQDVTGFSPFFPARSAAMPN
jgi:methylglyoxal synthase